MANGSFSYWSSGWCNQSTPTYTSVTAALTFLGEEQKRRSSFFGKISTFLFGSNVTPAINYVIQKAVNLRDKGYLKNIFFKTLASFSTEEFDRNKIDLRIQKILIDQGEEGPLSTYQIACLAEKLGISPTQNKGAHGSQVYRNLSGKSIAIFKPQGSGAPHHFLERVKQIIKKIFGIKGQTEYLCSSNHIPHGLAITERLSFVVVNTILSEAKEKFQDLALDQLGIPETAIVSFKKEKGSFQHFVEGYQEADHFDLTQDFSENSLTKLQIFGILDFILGNLDRKEDNWMIKKKGEEIEGIQLIDNGNGLTPEHLPEKARLARRYQYHWKKFNWASKALTKQTKKFVQSFEIEKVIDSYQKEIDRLASPNGGITDPKEKAEREKTIEGLRDRLKIVQHHLLSDSSSTLSSLAQYSTRETIDRFFNRAVPKTEEPWVSFEAGIQSIACF